MSACRAGDGKSTEFSKLEFSHRGWTKLGPHAEKYRKLTAVKMDQVTTLKLSNNKLSDALELCNALQTLLSPPRLQALQLLDLSSNNFTLPVAEAATLANLLPDLKALYLHGNAITELAGVVALHAASHLRALTLHGNPLLETQGRLVRLFVIHALPQLQRLDFTAVTHTEHERAKILCTKQKASTRLQKLLSKDDMRCCTRK